MYKEKKNSLDDITIGLYLEKHNKLREKYESYGELELIKRAEAYIQDGTYYGYLSELKKWQCVIKMAKCGFLITEDRLKDFVDMSSDDIYCEYEAYLNDAFANSDSDIKTYNACDGLDDLIEELDQGSEVGMPLYGCDLLNKEISGFNCNGNIYGLGAASGVGKSTTAINYLIPSIIQYNEKIVFFINEENQKKIQKEMIVWVANNIFKFNLKKYILRDGHFTEEVKKQLFKCADWLKAKKDDRCITIIPLPQYSVKTVIKLIKKYSSMGVKYFVLDTLKESVDTMTDDMYKSMMRDMVKLYDVVKPEAKNVGLWVTYQLTKTSPTIRYFTYKEIGQSKSIVDVMSVNLMMRRPFDDEFTGGKHEIRGRKLAGKNGKSEIPFKLEREKHYMITFINKNRFGRTDEFQIISEYDMSLNIYRDIGICNISQDW